MFSLVSLNARGLRNNIKRKALFLFAKQLKSDLFFLQESHSTVDSINFWRAQWGNTLWLSHGTERSAGVATLNDRFKGNIRTTECDPNGHYISQTVEFNGSVYIIANVYGYNTKKNNETLILELDHILVSWLKKIPNAFLLLGGDFNNILDNSLDKSPPSQHSMLTDFMERFNLIDIWREKSPNNRMYTWSNKSGTRQSRLDFWLISKSLDQYNIDVRICPTPLTDHKAIYISINTSNGSTPLTRSSYWKLNCSLLDNNENKKKIRNLISFYWSKANIENTFGTNWELLKYEIGAFLRKTGAQAVKARRAIELETILSITNLSSKDPESLTEEEKEELASSQAKLDELYCQKAKGAFIRSRSKWLEEGNKILTIFLVLKNITIQLIILVNYSLMELLQKTIIK